jgi:dihydroneopterin aldolase
MDKVMLKGLQFYGYHGVFPEEQRLGQLFLIDLVASLDLQPAGVTDQLDKTINYAEMYEHTKQIVTGPSVQLIESLAEQIASKILTYFELIEEITVTVVKPNPPVPGIFDSVAVEITRRRKV